MHITKICVLKFQGGSSEKFSDTRFLGAVKTFFVPFGNLLPSGRVTVKNVFRFFDLFLTELQNRLRIQILSVKIPCSKISDWKFPSVSDHWIYQRLQLGIDFVLTSGHFWFLIIKLSRFKDSLGFMKFMKSPSLLKVPAVSKTDKQVKKFHFNEIEFCWNWWAWNLFSSRWNGVYIVQKRTWSLWCKIDLPIYWKL